MSSKPECTMNDELYRHQVRHHFMGQVKNPQIQQKFRQAYMTEPSQHLKEQSYKPQQKIYEATLHAKQRICNLAPTSGGDADRMLFLSAHTTNPSGDSCRMRNNYDNFSAKQLQAIGKPSAPATTPNANSSSRKYQTTTGVEDFAGDHPYLYENDSNLCGLDNVSQEDSAKSQKSSKTVVSRKSSQDLRKLVTSQCKLHEVIGETLKEMCNTEVDNTGDNACSLQGELSNQYPLSLSQCKRCSDRIHSTQPQKDVTTEIGKGDFLDCKNTSTLTISVDDVINSRVVNPMIHKLHRMYLNNLKEEMSLMEDLERLPNKVNEVYKSIIFKPKE